MKHNFQIQLPQRSASCVIVETISNVYIHLEFSIEGNFNDLHILAEKLLPILSRYENDKRDVTISGKHGHGVIHTFSDNSFIGIMERNETMT